MTTINYPSSLPSPLLQSYQYQDVSKFIRTTMEQGYARQRKRFTQSPTDFQYQILLSQGALGHFEAWFKDELDEGIEWFNINLAVGDGTSLPMVARFTRPPRIQAVGIKWRVQMPLEVDVKPVGPNLTQDQIDYINAQGGYKKAQDAMDRFDLFVNTETKKAFA